MGDKDDSDGGHALDVADMPSAVLLLFEEYPNPLSGACGGEGSSRGTRHERRQVRWRFPLVVGVDGSEPCPEAVDWAAAEEALRHSVPLHLVPAAAGDRGPPDVIGAATERARKRAPTVQLSSEVLREDAIAALVAHGRNAFALVLGPRGLGDLAAMLLGAVSLIVAARADGPVVGVLGAAEPRDGRFGNVAVGVEEGEGSGTALQFALREAHLRSCG
ncbi:universal stress protein [Streptomyces pseudovenezuelae]|uniref:Universal stress protein n=1 Tax=Streptomyces pseudovenezuelae TaxID=67350 RepID=A0ABZ1WPE6_9ACTN|nr:universal stress protein [Streptomyces pseudovenezuelae]